MDASSILEFDFILLRQNRESRGYNAV